MTCNYFTVLTGKPQTCFCPHVMEQKKIFRFKCFIAESNDALCWLLENASDILDFIQWIINSLS